MIYKKVERLEIVMHKTDAPMFSNRKNDGYNT